MSEAMRRIGSDNMFDPPRIARLPYTVNLPNKSKRERGCVPVLARPETQNPAAKPRPVAGVCGDVKAVATQLGLPGKGGEGKSIGTAPVESASRHGATGERKSGHPAPSAEILRMALDHLPNDKGHFGNRDEWLRVGHAVNGAAVAGSFEDDGRYIW